jgi:hypothetical protein
MANAPSIPTSLVYANKINVVLNPIGIFFASIVLLSIIGLAVVNRQLTNRLTVRLVGVIAFTDLMAHVGEYYAAAHMTLEVGTSVCTSVNGFRLFARTFYCFTNLAICFHLYRSLVLLKKTTWKSELFIWVSTAVLVIAVTLFYWGIGAFKGVPARKRCTPGVDNPTLQTVFTIIQPTINLIITATGIFTIVSCRRNLNKWINAFSATITERGDNLDQVIQDRRKIAVRSFLYPLSTCITLPFEAIFLYMTAAGAYALDMAIPMALGSGLAGFLTFAAFAVDPSTYQAFKSAYYHIKHKNGGAKEQDGRYTMDNNDIAL